MFSHEDICSVARKPVDGCAMNKVLYFGTYADGRATDRSDLGLFVEFVENDVSILEMVGLKQDLVEMLSTLFDLIRVPIQEDSFLEIGKTMVAYEQ